MQLDNRLLKLLACPTTGNSLQQSGDTLKDESSEHAYPLIEGIPWLLPHPQNSLVDWSIKLNHFYQVLTEEISELEHSSQSPSASTQQRLQQLLTGKQSFIRTVFDLLSPVVRNPMASQSTYNALNDIAPNTQNLLSYEANLYRDWVWGGEENQLSANIVSQHIDKEQCKNLLVLGAGAGRLALDIHQACSPAITVATDINPLLVLAAKRIIEGHGLNIYEFPMQPLKSQCAAIEHQIAGITPPDNFYYAFSDATKPAFIKGSFDTVLTPWLIDIQPLELSRFLQQLNQYIDIGSQWVNFGSLVFHQKRDALCYSIEEVKAIAEQQGFEIHNIQQQQIPYLKSPYNAGHRVETVWSWSATKTKNVTPIEQVQTLPAWLLDIKKPIPKTNYFQQFTITHRTYAQLSAEVDGRTSINKIANKISKREKINTEEAVNFVRNLFIDLYRQNN